MALRGLFRDCHAWSTPRRRSSLLASPSLAPAQLRRCAGRLRRLLAQAEQVLKHREEVGRLVLGGAQRRVLAPAPDAAGPLLDDRPSGIDLGDEGVAADAGAPEQVVEAGGRGLQWRAVVELAGEVGHVRLEDLVVLVLLDDLPRPAAPAPTGGGKTRLGRRGTIARPRLLSRRWRGRRLPHGLPPLPPAC